MQGELTAQPVYLQGEEREPAGHVIRLSSAAWRVWMASQASTGESVRRVGHLALLHIVEGYINLQVLWVLYSITDMNQFRRLGWCLG